MISVEQIMKLIPHRYPMLLIDRVLEVDKEKAVTLKNVTINEDFFNGHFPGKPVMPGVLIVEAMAQSAAVFINYAVQDNFDEKVVFFMSIEEAKFRKPVVPGDSMHLHVSLVKNRGAVWKMKGEARVDGKKVAEAIFSAMVVDK